MTLLREDRVSGLHCRAFTNAEYGSGIRNPPKIKNEKKKIKKKRKKEKKGRIKQPKRRGCGGWVENLRSPADGLWAGEGVARRGKRCAR